MSDFYPRSPCGERQGEEQAIQPGHCISIHALLAESDRLFFIGPLLINNFYPRSPCGERLYLVRGQRPNLQISIHALLAESDVLRKVPILGIKYFYPRSPCGERLSTSERLFIPSHYFYPRSPCGERQYLVHGQRPNWGISIHALLAESDGKINTGGCKKMISIHALLAESDGKTPANIMSHSDFYPRSPCGERRMCHRVDRVRACISIHALLAESDPIH